MLGLNPLSSAPISSVGGYPAITGSINCTDSNDTANIIAVELEKGNIYAIDSDDTANIIGQVSTNYITGSINTTDNNDYCDIQGVVTQYMDMHDGFTPQEIRRAKELDKQARKLQEQRDRAFKETARRRKEAFADQIDPKPVVQKQQKSVKSKQEVKVDIPSIDLAQIERSLALVEKQKQELQNAAILRQQKAILEAQLAIYEAKRLANLDDEEALLLLL